MNRVIISGIGVEIPESLDHQRRAGRELQRLGRHRECRAGRPGAKTLLQKSDSDFIVYASGVKNRHVIERDGILDPDPHGAAHSGARRTTRFRWRPSSAWPRRGRRSTMPACEAADIDMVICAASHHQRPYPAIAIEIQNALGTQGRGLRHGARLLVGGGGPACRLQSGARRRAEARAGRDARDHHRASQFPRPADAFHLRRRLDRDGGRGARRGRDAARPLRGARHAQLDAVLQQHPHQFRLPARAPARTTPT